MDNLPRSSNTGLNPGKFSFSGVDPLSLSIKAAQVD
jgi:hypothetical protein